MMFGYSLIKTNEKDRLESLSHRLDDARRWLSGFKDLDVIWDWLFKWYEYPFRTDEMRDKYAKRREADVYGRSKLELQNRRLQFALADANESVRYALAVFRALDRYVYEDSDHALLIAEAVAKLETAQASAERESQDSSSDG